MSLPLALQPAQVPVTGNDAAEPSPVATPVAAAQLFVSFAVMATQSIPTRGASAFAAAAHLAHGSGAGAAVL